MNSANIPQSELRFKLSDNVTVVSIPAENSLWIEDSIGDLAVMLPLNASFDISYFEDDQSMVVVCPYEWSCVQLRTSRDRAEYFAKNFSYRLEIHEATPTVEKLGGLGKATQTIQHRRIRTGRKGRTKKARRK
jgi:hypothetical protein